jgi:4-carboxymuconolactone decarboxylase
VGDQKLLAERVGEALAAETPKTWVEELLLQSILMVGYPRALVATGVWRQVSVPPPPVASDRIGREDWTIAGERICRIVYGDNYDRLRSNVAALHPTLDDWMISEGYGRVLSRRGSTWPGGNSARSPSWPSCAVRGSCTLTCWAH